MKKNMNKLISLLLSVLLILSLAACSTQSATQDSATQEALPQSGGSVEGSSLGSKEEGDEGWSDFSGSSTQTSESAGSSGGAIDASELFTKRDLKQTAELSEAVTVTLTDGESYTVSSAGVYVLSGSVKNATVIVDAGDDDKVQLVLDGLTVTNDDFPAIYVKNADKVFLTTAEGSENSLSVTGSFRADGSTNTDAVIFSRDDLVLNGLGSLSVSSTDNGISCKDDLKITGGTLSVSAADHGIEANDSIAICDGVLTVTAGKDGLHAENDEDDSEGWIYVSGGSLTVKAADDGLHAVSILQIDGGTLDITAAEGLEATWVQINDGEITITASDDGINGARKSTAYTVCVEINGGTITISMGQGDTDGIDSNGNLIITGGTISITAQSPFDYDGTATKTGGTLIVNGTETDEITNQFGGMGGFGGMGNPGSSGNGGMGGPGSSGGGPHR